MISNICINIGIIKINLQILTWTKYRELTKDGKRLELCGVVFTVKRKKRYPYCLISQSSCIQTYI